MSGTWDGRVAGTTGSVSPQLAARRRTLLLSSCLTLALSAGWAAAPAETKAPHVLERYVAIDNVCAWPNLTLMPDGSIVATIFNQPSHGQQEGDVECWASTDGGRLWQRRGTPARHEPRANRMNVAAGLARNGDLIVLASGWSDEVEPGRERLNHPGPLRARILHPLVCRSGDGGRTWQVTKAFPTAPEGDPLIPFGDVVAGAEGSLLAAAYDAKSDNAAYLLRSSDDGRTWRRASVIGQGHNETALLYLGDGRWLAASRGSKIDLFESRDQGRSWELAMPLTSNGQVPGHLLQLADRRLLVVYGDRRPGHLGVQGRLSPDAGKTWGTPFRLAETTHWDCGYPASVQRQDGKIVTAYYARSVDAHRRYHMGTVIWNPNDLE